MEAEELGVVSADTHHRDSDIELIGGERVSHSPKLNKRVGRKSAKLNPVESTPIDLSQSKTTQEQNEEDYVEITMDIQGGSVALHSVTPVAGEDEKLGLLGKRMEKKVSFGSSLVRTASIRVKQVSQELKRFASFSKQTGTGARVHGDHRTKSAATHALKGLKFISKTGGGGAGWSEVEKQFEILTAKTDGYLHRSLFAKCIGIAEFKHVLEVFVEMWSREKFLMMCLDLIAGMNKESEAFAGELFDALSRRRDIHGDSINKAQLKDFWDQISDPGFDSRLRTFFDM